MSEITISINGRHYDVSCDLGQEGRVIDLAAYVDQKVKDISNSGAAYNDSHLLILTSLVLANEAQENMGGAFVEQNPIQNTETDKMIEDAKVELERLEAEKQKILTVIEQLTERVEGLTVKVGAL